MTRSAAPTPLRASPSRAAAQLGAAPLRQCSPTSPGPAAVLGASQGRKSIEAQGLYEKNSALWHAKDEIRQRPARPVFIGLPRRRSARLSWPLEGAEQRRGGREKGEHCLRAAGPSCAAPARPESRRGPRAAGRRPGVAFSLPTFFWRSKRKSGRRSTAKQSGGSTCESGAGAGSRWGQGLRAGRGAALYVGSPAAIRGRRRVAEKPPPGRLASSRVPPCRAATSRAMERPRPTPPVALRRAASGR